LVGVFGEVVSLVFGRAFAGVVGEASRVWWARLRGCGVGAMGMLVGVGLSRTAGWTFGHSGACVRRPFTMRLRHRHRLF
jgi:hypothetical protein